MGVMDFFRKIAGIDGKLGLVLVALIANCSTIVLALVLAYTFLKSVRKERSFGDLRVYENVLLFFTSDMWALYTYSSEPFKPLFFSANAVGFVLQIFCIFIYIYFAEGKKITEALVLFSTSFGIALIITGLVYWGVVPHRWSTTFIAVIASGSTSSIHIVTLFDLVMKRKQTKDMNLITLLISLFTALDWTTYGIMSVPVNPYIVVPNVMGILSAVLQLIMYAKAEETAETEPVEMVEMGTEHEADIEKEETNSPGICSSNFSADLGISSSNSGSDLGTSSSHFGSDLEV